MKYNGKEYYSQGDIYNAIEQKNKQLEIDKIHWRDLYREECEKNKKLKADSYNELQRLGLENYELREENKKLKKRIKELEKICERYEIENNIETMQKPIDPKILE